MISLFRVHLVLATLAKTKRSRKNMESNRVAATYGDVFETNARINKEMVLHDNELRRSFLRKNIDIEPVIARFDAAHAHPIAHGTIRRVEAKWQ